jgi:hypothetical protein
VYLSSKFPQFILQVLLVVRHHTLELILCICCIRARKISRVSVVSKLKTIVITTSVLSCGYVSGQNCKLGEMSLRTSVHTTRHESLSCPATFL